MFAVAKNHRQELTGKRRITVKRRLAGRMGKGNKSEKRRRNGGEEDVIPRLLEDDARARGDDSRIRCYPGRARTRREMHFPRFI